MRARRRVLPGFPFGGTSTTVQWQESSQNFAIAATAGLASATASGRDRRDPRGGVARSAEALVGPATLENPQPFSFQSGIGVISGWVCNAGSVDIVIDDFPAIPAAYGTSRNDTVGVCGDADNGFGLLFNWNIVGSGTHTLRARADGEEFAVVTFTVTTLGTEFLSGASGTLDVVAFPAGGSTTTLRWQESQQNFAISARSSSTTDQASDYLDSVESDDGAQGSTYSPGGAPVPGSGAPDTIQPARTFAFVVGDDVEPANQQVIPGGSNTFTIEFDTSAGAAAARRAVGSADAQQPVLIIAVQDASGAFLPGFFQFPLGSSAGIESLRFNYSQQLPAGDFSLAFATVANGVVGKYRSFPQHPVSAGTGTLQASLSWYPDQDLDLVLAEPGSGCPDDPDVCISFANRVGPFGGRLDLDSNRLCTIDGVNNENIFYPAGISPPAGVYRLFAGMSYSCDGRGAEATIIINRQGQRTALCVTYDASTAGTVFEVASFTYPPTSAVHVANTPFGVFVRLCGS